MVVLIAMHSGDYWREKESKQGQVWKCWVEEAATRGEEEAIATMLMIVGDEIVIVIILDKIIGYNVNNDNKVSPEDTLLFSININMMLHEAKLDNVKLFRVFLPHEFPPSFLYNQGLFLLNLKSYDQNLLRKLVYFKVYAIHRGDFSELAKQVISEIQDYIGPKSKELISRNVSDYLKSCFRYHRNIDAYPGLLFVLDILIDGRHCQQEDQQSLFVYTTTANKQEDSYITTHDFDEIFDDNEYAYFPSKLNNVSFDEIPFTNVEYQSLEQDDVEILKCLYPELMRHANVQYSEIILPWVFRKQKQTVEWIHTKDFGNDTICSICLDNLSSENAISLSRCNHVFHRDCIFRWLPGKHKCPYCRSSMLVDIRY
uniref:RING-type domain-containing protein n=2 Tax=Chenopodium quinoa TaxID=63459 RepID=A0A803N674_CHEQI